MTVLLTLEISFAITLLVLEIRSLDAIVQNLLLFEFMMFASA